MIKSITFRNFKALQNTSLRLGQLTILVGPNGSGKSTVFQALQCRQVPIDFNSVFSVQTPKNEGAKIEITIHWGGNLEGCISRFWRQSTGGLHSERQGRDLSHSQSLLIDKQLANLMVYSFDAPAIARLVPLQPEMKFSPDGLGLAGVLDRLRDTHPEHFEAVNEELAKWLPEFDRILFDTPHRALLLRTRVGGHKIKAQDISHGTLIALALLTLAYIPDPPPLICLEEPGRGIHPRLLRDVRDAMYRLAYPESFGEKREPVQVIATTHSPYMLDLFKDHPEEIVLAHKEEGNAIFENLADRDDLDEILQETHLGDAWYTGILGGVPTEK